MVILDASPPDCFARLCVTMATRNSVEERRHQPTRHGGPSETLQDFQGERKLKEINVT